MRVRVFVCLLATDLLNNCDTPLPSSSLSLSLFLSLSQLVNQYHLSTCLYHSVSLSACQSLSSICVQAVTQALIC